MEKTFEIEVSENDFILFCYEGEDCLWFQNFSSFKLAAQFGYHYIESDWNLTGFPVTEENI